MYSQAVLLTSLVGLAAAATTNTNLQTAFPASSGTTNLAAARTLAAGEVLDGGMKQWDRSQDAATFKQSSGTSYVNGGGARKADDKVLQHNGAGTVAVKNFWAQDVGKVYRSCGNCGTQYARKSTFDNIHVSGASVVAGVNGNLGDTTTIKNSCLLDGTSKICWLYKGVTSGEPSKTASAPDGKVCATSTIKTSGC
ncbi:hypothetical protein N0V90_007306 [Kalmusia sp. IMI 367209]|nr:hypothetical protein N0V90_007306 [Kalmusia sp. IMI 367209]